MITKKYSKNNRKKKRKIKTSKLKMYRKRKQKQFGSSALISNQGNIFKILSYKYFPIEEAIITAGRNCKITNSYGLRPKMSIIFSMPNYIHENNQNILMKSVACDNKGNEHSFSTVKYSNQPVIDNYSQHPGGETKFISERKVWLNLTQDVQISAATYRYLGPDPDIQYNGKFEIDFYPCRFLLKSGITHKNLYVEILPDSEITQGEESCDNIMGLQWDTYDVYIEQKHELKEKLLELPQVVSEITGINIEDIILDPSAENTLNDCS